MHSQIRPISLLLTSLFLSLIFINLVWAFECTDACTQTHLATGSFQVEGGTLEALEPPGDEGETPALLRRIAGAVLDFLVPSARAATEGASNNFFGTGAGANNSGDNNNSFFRRQCRRFQHHGCQQRLFRRQCRLCQHHGL